MKAARALLCILWTLTAVTMSIAALAFAYYRPTVYVANVYLDPRSFSIAAALGATLSLLVLGFGLRSLIRK